MNFQVYWEQLPCLTHFVLPQPGGHLRYQREVCDATLNLLHHLQKMMDLEVRHHRTLLLSQYQYAVLHHLPVYTLNQLIRIRMRFEGHIILTADLSFTESIERGKKMKHRRKESAPEHRTFKI